jgi:membrane-associated phospholipid phosphatase
VTDPLLVAAAVALLVPVVAGPAFVYGLESIPQRWRRTMEWSLIVGAALAAIAGDLLTAGPGGGGGLVYVLAALPGLLTYVVWRTLLATIVVSCAPLYFVIAILTRERPAHAPELALDRAMSVQSEWMIVYGSLYVFAVVLPLLAVREAALFRRALQAYLLVMLVAYAGFLLYPTVAPRPADVSGVGFAAWTLRLAYSLDPPYNCFPSLHVAYSFVSALTCFRVHRTIGIGAIVWAALIGVSTVYTKQHYVVDVIAGAVMACAAYLLFLRGYSRAAVSEGDRRRARIGTLSAVGLYGIVVAGFWLAYKAGMTVS